MDLHDNIEPVVAVAPVVSANNAALQSAVLSRAGYHTVEFLVTVGAVLGTPTFTLSLTEGELSNGGDLAAVNAGLIIGTLPVITAAGVYRFGYIGVHTYLQVTATPTGNTGSGLGTSVGINLLLADSRKAPTA